MTGPAPKINPSFAICPEFFKEEAKSLPNASPHPKDNKMPGKDNQAETTPSRRILKTAFVVGGISFAAGFFGPMVFSDSNLGPLLGIFITGPIGFFGGALLGLIRSIIKPKGHVGRAELVWYFLIFFFALVYYTMFGNLLLYAGLASIGLALSVILTGAILLVKKQLRAKLPKIVKKCGAIVLVAAGVMVAMAIFPPVMEPWWGDKNLQEAAKQAMPRYAFFLDSRFDSSRAVPEFVIDKKMLAVQWFLTSVAAALVCLFAVKRQ